MTTKEEWYQFKIRLLCMIAGFISGMLVGFGIALGG